MAPSLELRTDEEPLAAPAAETTVVAAFLIGGDRDQEALDRVQGMLESWMFTRKDLRLLYDTVARLRAQGTRPDVVTISEGLKDRGKLEEAGGYDLLAGLTDAVPTAANVEYHARIIREKASRRRYRNTLLTGLKDIEEQDRGVPELLEAQRERIEVLQRSEGTGVHLLTLAEVLADPDALKPPPRVVPNLAWAGRVTMLAAREKLGKSTLASAAAAAKTQGIRIFGEAPELGGVLYVGLEEHQGDLARRLSDFGAHPDRVTILPRVGDPLADLENAVHQVRPSLTVVDTLAALVGSLDLDPGNSSAWVPVMLRLARVARDSGTGMLVLHHANKAKGEYRDSTAIGGGVDAIVTMKKGEVEGVRKFECVGRWTMEDFSARLVERDEDRPAYFEMASQEISLDAKVLAFLEHHPKSSKRAVRDAVKGRAADIDSAIFRLLKSGSIRDEGSEHRSAFSVSPGNPHGHGADTVGNRSGHGVPSHGAEVCPDGAPLRSRGSSDTHPGLTQGRGGEDG